MPWNLKCCGNNCKMRFKLTLSIDKQAFGNRIAFNYMYECSALIYKILYKSDAEFSSWLHGNGFAVNGKRFRLFTFSRLQIPSYRIDGSFISIQSDTIEWLISFLPVKSTREFVQGLFLEREFELGNRQANIRCRVRGIEVLPPPEFTGCMRFETLSPVCITLKGNDGRQQYIPPSHTEAERLVRLNLFDKYRALCGEEFPARDYPFALKVLTTPKPSLITIKAGTPQESKVRGYLCSFSLTAPAELIKIAYEAGIGGKNSMGFGMIKSLQ